MVIVLGFYKRKQGTTHAQFVDHWLNVHGPLIQSIPSIEKYLVRYVQHHLTPDSSVPTPDGMDFDGFSEGWFVDRAARDTLFDLDIFKTEMVDDENKFIDMSATRWVVIDEQHVIMPGPAGLAG